MRTKEYFDVSRIISIYFKSETPSTNFYWVEREPIKKFFGLINLDLGLEVKDVV